MAVYHITYTPELKEACLYFDKGCNFQCHGCISKFHPEDCHLDEIPRRSKNRTLSEEEVISYLKPLSFKKVIFLGWEPTVDPDFLPLAKILKERFSTYNIFLTNGWEYVEDEALNEVCVSIKAITESVFKKFTRRSDPQRVLANFKRYVSNPFIKVRAESVFIPDYIDKEEIRKIIRFISSIDNNIPYRIDGYIPTNAYFKGENKFRRPTEDEMKEVKRIAEMYLKNVSILYYGVSVKYKVKRIY